jgi:hypothetical protein
MLLASKDTETDRFWGAQEEIEKEVKILQSCLDGHSRGKMWLHAGLMFRYGMLSEEDLEEFSEEFAAKIKRASEA